MILKFKKVFEFKNFGFGKPKTKKKKTIFLKEMSKLSHTKIFNYIIIYFKI